MKQRTMIEYWGEPLSPDKRGRFQRGQLHVTITGPKGSMTHPIGSPAPWETIKANEKATLFA